MSEFLSIFSNATLDANGVRLPTVSIEESDLKKVGLDKNATNFAFLRELCLKGFSGMNLKKGSPEYKQYGERAKYELDIFQELGFVDYILMVWDVIDFCKKNNIPTGLGRGSAGGSLVLFLIGVTKIDPVKYGLYFERFVSKIRAKKKIVNGITYLDGSLMCDVDMDICYYRRHEVLEYLKNKYKGRTSKILTFNSLSSKLLVKEIGKIAGEKSEEQVKEISSMIPTAFGKPSPLDEACADIPEFKKWSEENPFMFKICRKLEGLIKNKGVHPSGVLVSYEPCEDICPTELSSDKDLVSSVDMEWVSSVCVKLDILGLRGVSVVDDVCKALNISVEDIDVNDPIIYQNLQDLKSPHGLFQIEADFAFQVTRKVKPKSLLELSAVLALARPGALAYIDQYSNFTNNGQCDSIHPFFDDILRSSGNVCLYQEQLLKMVNKIGFSLDDSEQVRRCVGKKKVEEMALWEKRISDKIKEQKLDPKIGEILWDIAKASANYSFNLSHSVAYSALAAVTVYLKFKYPQQFFLSLLRMTRYEPDPLGEIYKIQKEMSKFGIRLLRPDLTKSSMHFAIEGLNIRFGLMSIKGISEGSLEALEKFRGQYKNKFDIFEAANQSKINVGVLCALIQAGCFESAGESRSYVVYQAQLWSKLTDREKVFARKLGEESQFSIVAILQKMATMKNEKGKEILKPSRIQTIKKETKKYTEIFDLNKKNEPLANWWYETKLLGYSCTSSLKEVYSNVPGFMTIEEAKKMKPKSTVFIGGLVDEKPKTGTSKKGSKYIKIQVKDETDVANTMIFNERVDNLRAVPEVDELVLIKGTIQDGETIFIDILAPQSAKIYTKLSELKSGS